MESTILKRPRGIKANKKIIICLILIFALLTVGVSAYLVYSVLTYDKVYAGVYINDVHVGNMFGSELNQLLGQTYQEKIDENVIILKSKEHEEAISFQELGIAYDITDAINRAYSVGRTGTLFSNIIDISRLERNGQVINMSITYDVSRIEKAVKSLSEKTNAQLFQHEVAVLDGVLVIKRGQPAVTVMEDQLLKSVENIIGNLQSENIIEVPVVTVLPEPLDAQPIFDEIFVEKVEPSFKYEDGILSVEPGTNGVSIDRSELDKAVDDINSSSKDESRIPLIITAPGKNIEDLEGNVFIDNLYTASSKFNTLTTNNANRAENIKLTTEAINGLILLPGEVFSFNDIVGQRTAERGYKTAHVYYDGKIVDGTGGGICQASSTLHLAAFLADLEIVERFNHMFTIGYLPLGSDAAVSWGWPDFKFRNNTNWPIRIDGEVTEDNEVVYSIIGTNENLGKTIEIYSPVVETYNFKTRYIDDPNLPQGEEIIQKYGITGYRVDTYKIVKQDGEIVSEKRVYTSYYQPDEQVVRRGTRVVEPVEPELGDETVELNSYDETAVEAVTEENDNDAELSFGGADAELNESIEVYPELEPLTDTPQ